MVKRQTIALLASEEQVPLVLTARQQALVDAVANRMLPAERNPYRLSTNRARRPGRGPDRAEAADRDGQNAR